MLLTRKDLAINSVRVKFQPFNSNFYLFKTRGQDAGM